MSTLKKLIIIILIIILIILSLILLYIYKGRGEIFYDIEEKGNEAIYEIDKTIQRVKNRNNFYIIETCINKYYSSCTLSESNEVEPKLFNEETYNLLDEKYIDFKKITKENITKIIPKINPSIVNISDMYVSQQKEDISIYIVNGTLREKKSGKISQFKIMIQLDTKNRTFTVFLQDYIENNYKDLNVGDNLGIQLPNHIENKINNNYDYRSISEETYVLDLFNKYREEILYNIELAYKNLDEEYRNNRFGTLEKFKEYSKNNIKTNVMMKLDKYEKVEMKDYTQYVCVDQNGNYYIFRETAVKKYSLLLDTYTVDLPEFLEKYNVASDIEKVGYNIQKFIESINCKDYNYAYNKLDETFKNNKFVTLSEFEKYIKNNLFEKNIVDSSVTTSSQNDIYIYNINVKNKENQNEIKELTIIMKLKEGTDFTMSFDIK